MPPGFVALFVRLTNHASLKVTAPLDEPLSALLPLVAALEGAAPGTVRLTQGGRALLDCARIPRDLNLHTGSTLEAQGHMRGGERGHSPMHNCN